MSQRKLTLVFGFVIVIAVGLLMPQKFFNPVSGSTKHDYNSKSFWYYPWGSSGTHKGVDIFAKEGARVNSATGGLVVYAGTMNKAGNVVVVLGPKWRLHCYAHLQHYDVHLFSWTSAAERIGAVGSTGNAKGKQPHLHYTIVTMIPYFWRIDESPQGWKKMFYLNPIDYLRSL